MGAGDAQRVPIVLGDRAPGLRPLKDRDAARVRLDDLGVVVVGGGGAHQKFHIVGDILRPVADMDREAVRAQFFNVAAVVHIRAGDDDAHSLEDLRKGGHGHAADADQVALAAGREEIVKFDHGISAPKKSIDVGQTK